MSGIEKTIKLNVETGNMRLDAYIADNTDISRSFAERLVTDEFVKVNGVSKPKKYKVKSGDSIVIDVPREEVPELTPVKMDIEIIYDCDEFAVINKPAGITVHPAPGHADDTIVNAMLAEFDITDDNDLRPGIVHRLDKDTSGLMIVAKNRKSREVLSKVFADRDIDKRYLAVCWGKPKELEFTIEQPIGRHYKDRKRMCVREDGRYSKSGVRVLKQNNNAFLAEIRIFTGRTHQIRVHMSHAGFPLAGDVVYGHRQSLKLPIKRQALHSFRLAFVSPFTGEDMVFESPLPLDMKELIIGLKL
ncbi:pseudouridine synthase, RluA family [Denitrovibrio acetiphilus DSM 12809]|uniref:Pseudouridine synthase n=1 Tax=Denitrovibrio acetiphilus (strain DSM 12809 / NBRC 114555 / N2460) TaxID=522772 RepID=D4H168_DENA2|nr:RluA family pseudouridine synthase [Denitrovibrio acetiphilus]ADD66816.1 pseudouridine synthase, RluA family [Denitrovibrio acetiphilus DSM 12809]